MNRAISFSLGALVGAVIGAVLALLFAPASGEELRGQIRDRSEGLLADIRQATDTKRIELQERLETLRAPRE